MEKEGNMGGEDVLVTVASRGGRGGCRGAGDREARGAEEDNKRGLKGNGKVREKGR